MLDEPDTTLDERGRRLFAVLPRESIPDPHELDHLVSALRAEGFFRVPPRKLAWVYQVAAAVVLLVIGAIAGSHYAARNSLEVMLERTNLSVSERILLMQRAGSAYVRASNAYAGSVAKADSVAVEVAGRVLLGAAQAVARSDLDGGMSSRITAALRARIGSAAAPPAHQRVIWF